MCGRFTLSTPPDVLAAVLGLPDPPALSPRYNIAPTQEIAVVRAAAATSARELVLMHWGLIPSWAKDRSIGVKMINARSETAAEKPSFRSAMRHRRCLIPADGFFEWRLEGGAKQPYLFREHDGAPFAFAGLWEHWEPQGEPPVTSCTILTTAASEFLRTYHERMPVILPPDAYAAWLDPERKKAEDVVPLLAGAARELVAVAVSRRVNDARQDDPACVAPIEH